jgi:hypothetical protein
LTYLPVGSIAEAILGLKRPEGLKLAAEKRNSLFEHEHKAPPETLAQGKDRPLGVKAVGGHGDREAGKAPLEPDGQPVEGLQFAVLLVGPGIDILDEFGHQREDESSAGHQLGLQDRVIIAGDPVPGLSQAMGTVTLFKGEHAGAVNSDHVVAIQQTLAVKRLFADHPL